MVSSGVALGIGLGVRVDVPRGLGVGDVRSAGGAGDGVGVAVGEGEKNPLIVSRFNPINIATAKIAISNLNIPGTLFLIGFEATSS